MRPAGIQHIQETPNMFQANHLTNILAWVTKTIMDDLGVVRLANSHQINQKYS
jgi:tellurite resistance-related uncharacterized protein